MSVLKNYYNLSKPGITRMVMITAAFGYLLGAEGIVYGQHFISSLLGIGIASAGSAALNNWWERDLDKKMDRTKNREIPSGKIKPGAALFYGLAMVFIGLGILVYYVNNRTATLVLLTALLYVLVYTPLKQVHWINTSVGAIPGALPMSCGWVAATDEYSFGAWVVFLILFSWQHPHFYAIAWIYKEDYAKGGHKMLSVVDEKGHKLFFQVILYTFLMIFASLVPFVVQDANWVYAIGAAVLGLYMLYNALLFVTVHTKAAARRLLKSSIIYLPLLLIVTIIDFYAL